MTYGKEKAGDGHCPHVFHEASHVHHCFIFTGWAVWLHFTDGKTKAQGGTAEWLPSLHPPSVPQKGSHGASPLSQKPREAMRCKTGEVAEKFNWRLCQKHPKAGWLRSHKVAEEMTQTERHKKFTPFSESLLPACRSPEAGPSALH